MEHVEQPMDRPPVALGSCAEGLRQALQRLVQAQDVRRPRSPASTGDALSRVQDVLPASTHPHGPVAREALDLGGEELEAHTGGTADASDPWDDLEAPTLRKALRAMV